jgi:rhodanese-related sulfurtransferase
MTLKLGYKQLLEAAESEIVTPSPEEANLLMGDDNVQFVGIRELQREDKVPDAFHATRGMLEFWIDPESPYHKEIFGTGKKYIFYCQSGWRSALATQTVQQMGLPNVCHIKGGFRAWMEKGNPVETVDRETQSS